MFRKILAIHHHVVQILSVKCKENKQFVHVSKTLSENRQIVDQNVFWILIAMDQNRALIVNASIHAVKMLVV